MFGSMSRSLFWRGLVLLAIGVVAIVYPGVTLSVVVAIFVVVAFVDAVHQGTRAFSSERAGPVFGHLLLAVLDVAGGVVALAWPGLTVEVLTLWIGVWAALTGFTQVAMAFMANESAGDRAYHGFGGAISILFGVVLFRNPDVGAVSLAEVFGLFAFAFGAWSLVLAASTRATGSRIDKALGTHA